MARLKKGVVLLRVIPPEYSSPNSERRKIGYRHVLVDWLNRALSRTAADREAAERIGALIKGMNDNNPKSRNTNPDGIIGAGKLLSQHAPWYELKVDLWTGLDDPKWYLVVVCIAAPSGEGRDLGARWKDEVRSPELEAVEAIVHIALDGQLGTIRQCGVGSCRKWFLTKDDPRVRCCPDHDADDLRKGTPERKKQVNAAAAKARERAKTADEKYWARRRGDKLVRPGPRRAEK